MADIPTLVYDGPVPKQVRLPSLADLGKLSPDDLVTTLANYGVVLSLDDYAVVAAKYISRMTNLTGTPFDEELARVLKTDTALLEAARELRRDWVSAAQADGDGRAEFIWLTELDDSVCGPCEERGGDIRTYDEWAATGLPGAGVCDGGSRCRCELIRFED